MNFVHEFLYVLAVSKRTHRALICGVVFYLLINFVGDHYVAEIEFQGVMKSYQEVIVRKLSRKYDKFALGVLITFWGLALKFYCIDRKRL